MPTRARAPASLRSGVFRLGRYRRGRGHPLRATRALTPLPIPLCRGELPTRARTRVTKERPITTRSVLLGQGRARTREHRLPWQGSSRYKAPLSDPHHWRRPAYGLRPADCHRRERGLMQAASRKGTARREPDKIRRCRILRSQQLAPTSDSAWRPGRCERAPATRLSLHDKRTAADHLSLQSSSRRSTRLPGASDSWWRGE
jgi:hypothetical protein